MQRRRVGLDVNGVAGGMKGQNSEVAIAAVGKVLIIGEDLVDEVAIDGQIDAATDALAGGVRKMAIQDHADLAGLADKLLPKGLAVIVGAYVVILRVDVVA